MKIRHTLALAAGPMAALSITVPASVGLGSGAPGTSISAQLGSVTVIDARAQLTTAWTASVTSAALGFTTGGGTTAETVPNTDVSYWSGAATASVGNGTLTPGQATVTGAVVLSAPRTAFSLAAGTGNNSVTWDPTVIVAVPITNAAGLYSGTITHSVA
jgi:hypothetical protein